MSVVFVWHGERAVLIDGEKEKDLCAYAEQYPGVWPYFEQNLVRRAIILHIIALDIANRKN
jgi:hypothetical protein